MKSGPPHYVPSWRKLMYQRLAKSPNSDFVERVLLKTRRK